MTTLPHTSTTNTAARELLPTPCGWVRTKNDRYEVHIGEDKPHDRSNGNAGHWAALFDTPRVLDALAAALATGKQGARESAWLIEFRNPHGQTPTWWRGEDKRAEYVFGACWTTDANKAMRFCREEDARMAIAAFGLHEPNHFPAEHVWIDSLIPQQGGEQEAGEGVEDQFLIECDGVTVDVAAFYKVHGYERLPPTVTLNSMQIKELVRRPANYQLYPYIGGALNPAYSDSEAIVLSPGMRFIAVPPACF